jgi:hypothetical protein
MNTKNQKMDVFKWVFFFISCGALITAGIFIEKIILTDVVWVDYFSAISFAALGFGISAYSFFRPSEDR